MSNHSKQLIQVLNYDQKSWIHTKTLSNGHGRSLDTTFLLKTRGMLILSSLDFGTMILNTKKYFFGTNFQLDCYRYLRAIKISIYYPCSTKEGLEKISAFFPSFLVYGTVLHLVLLLLIAEWIWMKHL